MKYELENLSNAVVAKACSDWRNAMRKILKAEREIKMARGTIQECEEFFFSKRFSMFSEIDPNVLITRMCRELRVEDDYKRDNEY